MGLMKDLQGLGAAYASMHQTDESYTLTAADKRGNTVAWQNRKKENVKTGQPLYKYSDHLQKEEESRLWDEVAHNLTELHELGGVKFKVIPISEKESYKTVAAVIDYDRSKKGTDDATYDSEHGEKKKAKKERDYAAWEREKMKKDDPNWKHKKGSTSESVQEDAQSDAVAQMSGAGGDPQSDAVKQVSGGGKKSKKGGAHAEIDRIRKKAASQKVKKEDKDWGYDKKGNSLNPVDIEKKKKKDDDLAGSPNKVKEALEASGIFTAEEIENLLWNEFDEDYQQSITEISSGKLLDAARASEVARGKKASAGDKEGASKEVTRSSKFFNAALGKIKSAEEKAKKS